jgi:hypothetical protein
MGTKLIDTWVNMDNTNIQDEYFFIVGFKHSPSYAQRFMDNCQYEHKEYWAAYIDDIITFREIPLKGILIISRKH